MTTPDKSAPSLTLAIPCPGCHAALPGTFDMQSHCPFCGYEYGQHARLCLSCDRAWFPVFLFCPECGEHTGVVKIVELSSIELGWNVNSPDYAADYRFGTILSDLSYGNEHLGFSKVIETHNLKKLIKYPRRTRRHATKRTA